MSVVSNTSPLNYLALIGCAEILPVLYGRVIIPPAVIRELKAERTPDAVKKWINSAPAWLQVEELRSGPDISLAYLGRGEQEAIMLALQSNTALLIDDRDGRREAENRSLKVIGTLGVLVDAASAQVISIQEPIERLQRTSFRASPRLFKIILERRSKSPG